MAKRPSDQRKAAILDAVLAVIIETGFTEMTVADVARRAGVSTALVHYHFSSKAALITAALAEACEVDKLLREGVANGPGSAVSRLDRALCGSLPGGSADASWLLWIETWGETRRNPEIRNLMADLTDHEVKVLDQLFAQGAAAGEFVCADPVRAAARLSALRDGLAIQQTLFGGGSPELFVEQLRGAIRYELGLDAAAYEQLVVADR